MKTRILFLDDEPRTARHLKDVLEQAGYVIVAPKNQEHAFDEINNGVELIVHSAHFSKTYWNLCDAILTQYPQLPSLHLATGAEAERFQSRFQGAFHQKVRPLMASRDFLRKVRRLIFMGRLHRQNTDLNRAVKLQNQIDQVFETMDYNQLRIQTVEFFAREFKAKNAFFLSTGGFGYFMQEMWKVTTINTGDPLPTKHALCSANPSSVTELTSITTDLNEFLPKGWELKQSKTVIVDKGGYNKVCFIPLVGPASKKILGHVMIVDPLIWGDRALEKVLPYLTRVLSRHFEHTVNMAATKSLTYTDDLTELYNQRYLKLVLDKEINRAARSKTPFSVLFMDIDHFKKVNDTRGHIVGSKVLIGLAKILHNQLRATDYGFRYGGDEFILILVGSDSNQALLVAERIRKQVEAASFQIDETTIKVTLSIGIATYPDHAVTKEEILELADRAMYCGKNKSRNVVYVAS